MKINAQTLRNLVDGHGWIGLFISVPLFLVFWAGSITFFLPEVYRWQATPHFPVAEQQGRIEINKIIEQTVQDYDVDATHRMFLSYPGEHSPYIRFGFFVYDEPSVVGQDQDVHRESSYTSLIIDPKTGKTLTDKGPFELSEFFFVLHYNLKLPQGDYVVGFITLFFLMLVLTGIVIQLKNLIKHFFMYRSDRTTRYKMNDLHNVVGVITLPYGLMFALTGLMFNLNIIAQVPTVLVLYDGNLKQVLVDAGSPDVRPKFLNKAHEMPNVDKLITQLESEANVKIDNLNLYNYGDESAMIRIRGEWQDRFAENYARYYDVKAAEFPEHLNQFDDNVFVNGTRTLYNLHFANFAGLDLRFIYFILGIGVCGMIIAGNVLWLVKRQKRNATPKTIRVMRGLTLGGCAGAVPATALAFFLERVLSLDMAYRIEFVQWGFGFALFAAIALAFVYRSNKTLIGHYALVSSLLLALTVCADWFMFGSVMLKLVDMGQYAAVLVSLSLAVLAVLFGYLAKRMLTPMVSVDVESEMTAEATQA